MNHSSPTRLSFLLLALAAPWLPAAPAVQVTTRVAHPPEMGEVTSYVVTSPLGAFTFPAPKGWRLELDAPARQIFLHSPDDTIHLEATFAAANPALAPDASTNALREQVTARFPKGEILEEFHAYTATLAGHGFDIMWQPFPGVTSVARCAFLACPGGALEFRLTTSPDKFSAHQALFGAWLTSFTPASESDDTAKPNAMTRN